MIPDFDHNHVIPPHVGNPTSPNDLSPYKCNILDFCHKFATSKERIEILEGFIEFRGKLNNFGIIDGFQWIDGSFTEDIESRDNRSPNDLDLVTFYKMISLDANSIDSLMNNVIANFKEFFDPSLSKTTFKLDHYNVDYGYSPDVTIENTRYWLQLFSHNRLDVWKGILRIELNTPTLDQEAKIYLQSLKK
ncbi:hypothetical protein [Flavobacterium sp. ACN6]|uniref:DUF6932 family protein n=1 Tax=Flavobacterium sp. ACN6 TaxID=1920426 RepID=UPI000BB31C8D|nr:hypothetical protein [Flavobacterium sp. ACN6]PBJ11514.1 hypothetical protein BSF42_29210 [Flavobacterium sp. ACN6]